MFVFCNFHSSNETLEEDDTKPQLKDQQNRSLHDIHGTRPILEYPCASYKNNSLEYNPHLIPRADLAISSLEALAFCKEVRKYLFKVSYIIVFSFGFLIPDIILF
jgi:hypothetical protein